MCGDEFWDWIAVGLKAESGPGVTMSGTSPLVAWCMGPHCKTQ